MPIQSCRICGDTTINPYLKLKNNKEIFACRLCGNGMTVPEPSVNYEYNEFFILAKNNEMRWRSYSQQIAQFIKRHYQIRGRLLDVGCSHGFLLEEASALGFESEGIEPAKSAVEYCQERGLKIKPGYLKKDSYNLKEFEIVVMSHVIEHVVDPYSLLEIVKGILKEGGVVCFSQTNYLGTLPRLLGKYWFYWVPDEHYFHFSPLGIQFMLRKAGFSVIAMELQSLGYHLDFQGMQLRGVLGFGLNAFCWAVSRLRLGIPYRGDQMFILARAI